MRRIVLLITLLFPVMLYASEVETSPAQKEPRLYDYYVALKRMQESLASRSLEEQGQLQPTINRVERQACEQVQRERQDRVSKEEYRREGGDQFLVFAQQFEQYCQTVRALLAARR